MSIADQARKLGVSERDLYRFYRGLGPKPKPAQPAPNSEPSEPESVEYLGGGWYLLPDGQKVRGLSNIDSEEEE